MKSTTCILFLIIIFVQFSCDKKEPPLEQAKQKISESSFISYDEESYWPNPVNPTELIDTFRSYNEFAVNPENFLGYDFIATSNRSDLTFINGDYRIIDHGDSLIQIYTPLQVENTEKFEKTVKRLNIEWSPMIFLTEEWEFVRDTVFQDRSYADYFQIEMDTVVDNKKLYVERHLYINYETSLIDRFERTAFAEDGSISQQVSRNFYNYDIQTESRALSYSEPSNYVSTYGRKKRLKLLKAGDVAPEFALTNINGDTVKLSNFKGSKVLLDFSVINCGYCQKTLQHINKDDFELADKVQWLYINPEDGKERMKSYMEKLEIPFPVLTDAKTVGAQYGVNGYPTFFLINEDGIIETVQSGYSDRFINSFKM